MFIVPDVSKVVCLSSFCLRYSYVIVLIIPTLILLWLYVRKQTVRLLNKEEQAAFEAEKKPQRSIFFAIRALLLVFLFIAIASPFLLETKTIQGNPRITILVDNSTSMNLFEDFLAKDIESKLKETIPVTVRTIAQGERSGLGDGILNNMERNENLLVISDGNSNKGTWLGDVLLLASTLNATVSTINMQPQKSDARVSILGPSESIRDTEETFHIEVKVVGNPVQYSLEVRFDNEVVLSITDAKSQQYSFKRKLNEGFHTITAELHNVAATDYFPQNNRYFKTVKVVSRPKIVFVSEKPSLLADNLGQIYDVTILPSVPQDLSSYLAVIMNDIPVNKFLPHVERLSDYVSDGNGLFVIGGQSSYDRDGYRGTFIETLLPAKVGAGEASDKSDVHVVIVIDVSGTTGVVYNANTGQYEVRGYDEIIKAQAASVIESLDIKNNVGVVVAGTKDVGSVTILSEILTLKDAKNTMVDKISKIDRDKVGGQTIDIKFGIDQAHKMLREVSGGKNIILLSDGRGIAPRAQQEVLDAVANANGKGMRIYVVGIGATDEQDNTFLANIASIGGGTYFPADANNRLKILFGEADEKDTTDFLNKLALLDTTHFITYNQSLDVVVTGYNYMIPKPSARLLITTNKNIPIMAVWRFGLGRVISLGTDDGGKWSGEFLQKDNSKILTKSINWAIGDLSRKKSFDVSIQDSTLDKPMTVRVTSPTMPQHNELRFVKVDVNAYSATYEPKDAGFVNFLGADAAVNYKEEYAQLGMDSEFTHLIEQTQGKVFEKDDIEGMLEFIKEKSKRIKVNSTDLKWPFIILVILILLIDIGLRRYWENKSYR